MKCPGCGNELEEVRQSPVSMLSAEQFDADRLGDWFCRHCPPTAGTGSGVRYFWRKDLPEVVGEGVPLTGSADLHADTEDLVDRFTAALKDKLAAAQRKYGYTNGWRNPDWMDECRADLLKHVAKGDPRDVAAYCAFLWHHGQPTSKGGV